MKIDNELVAFTGDENTFACNHEKVIIKAFKFFFSLSGSGYWLRFMKDSIFQDGTLYFVL